MSKKNPSIHCFEPTPSTAFINRRIRDYNFKNYQVNQFGVSSTIGQADLYISTKAETSNSLSSTFRNSNQKITVKLDTLDNYFANGAPHPDIIKIDVETLESEVLTGARKLISSYKPIITCEFLPNKDTKKYIGESLSWLNYYNYSFYQITGDSKFEKHGVFDALESLSSFNRDWILTPLPLEQCFYDSMHKWREALKVCDESTIRLYDGGNLDPQILKEYW